uniref:Uncharacterized protein MANES_12G126600 n=1 Tax=Rhizophora mucronata TaxID=61149 RepID=A0A2P2MYD5_RHIMU
MRRNEGARNQWLRGEAAPHQPHHMNTKRGALILYYHFFLFRPVKGRRAGES